MYEHVKANSTILKAQVLIIVKHRRLLKPPLVNRVLQEAPLTIRGQRGCCSNIKGEPQIYGSFLTQSHAYFSSGCGFMVSVGKSKLCTKFEVPSFSHCVEPQNFRKIP